MLKRRYELLLRCALALCCAVALSPWFGGGVVPAEGSCAVGTEAGRTAQAAVKDAAPTEPKQFPQVAIVVKVSPAAQYKLVKPLRDESLLRALRKPQISSAGSLERRPMDSGAMDSGSKNSWPIDPSSMDTYLQVVHRDGRITTFMVNGEGQVYSPQLQGYIALSGKDRKLVGKSRRLLRARYYGELVSWSEADRLLGRMDFATVMDVETGKSFRMQRRAGKNHADVQPLTRQDSAALKEAFGGSWSWNRRGVLVLTGTRRLAASMHGMPHGGDGIPDNGFNGHVCIHFSGSTTHSSDKLDLAHQAMVHKAAGELPRFLAGLEPEQLVELFVAMLNQRDQEMLKRLIPPEHSAERLFFAREMDRLLSIRLADPPAVGGKMGNQTAKVPVRLSASYKDGTKQRLEYVFIMHRSPQTHDGWRIAQIQINGQGIHAAK